MSEFQKFEDLISITIKIKNEKHHIVKLIHNIFGQNLNYHTKLDDFM